MIRPIMVVCYGGAPLPLAPSFFACALNWGAHEGRPGDRQQVGLATVGDVVRDWCDEAWIAANTWRFIEKVKVLETRNEDLLDDETYPGALETTTGWQGESDLAQGDYDVWVTEER